MRAVRVDAAIVGAQKCGTTSLYRALARHPGVFAPAAKESRAFTLADRERDRALAALYPPTQRLCLHAYAHALAVDGALASMRAHNPAMRLIAVLRDPVARAWSAYHFARRNGWETLDIHDALDAEAARRGGARIARVELQYVANGRYAALLQRALTVFPREQLLVLRTETLGDLGADALAPALSHLGLPDADLPPMSAENPAARTRLRGLHATLLGESAAKRAARRVLPARWKTALHAHLTAPLLAWNLVPEPLPPLPDDVRRRLEHAFAADAALLDHVLGPS